MINPHSDYEQDKINSSAKQTVIIDEIETGETDESDPNFHETSDPEPDPSQLDGEGIDESQAGLDSGPDESKPDNAGLNHSSEDDLSLNTPEDDIL